MSVAENGEFHKYEDCRKAPTNEREFEQHLDSFAGSDFCQEIVEMGDEEARQHQFENVCWEIVMQEQGSVIKEVR